MIDEIFYQIVLCLFEKNIYLSICMFLVISIHIYIYI